MPKILCDMNFRDQFAGRESLSEGAVVTVREVWFNGRFIGGEWPLKGRLRHVLIW